MQNEKELKKPTPSYDNVEILGHCILCESEFPVYSIYDRERVCPECKALWKRIKEREVDGNG